MRINNFLLILIIFCFRPAFLQAQDQNLLLANEELTELASELKYADKDITNPIVSDHYTSGGVTHIYYQQAVNQIGIYGTSAAVHIKNNEIISSNLQFLKGLEKKNIQQQFQIQALEAVARLALAKGYPLSQTELIILESNANDPQQSTTVSASSISNRKIPLKLVFLENEANDLQLAWSVFIDEKDGANYKNFIVNASTGAIEKEINLTITCSFDHDHSEDFLNHNRLENIRTTSLTSQKEQTANSYNVYPIPVESPNFGARTIEQSPWSDNTTASPNGWHTFSGNSYTSTRGNNVDAYLDTDDTNSPTGGDAARVDGGSSLMFDHSINTSNPAVSQDAAVTNLFYWNNITHDIWYNYGFDEVSGNFQEENYSRGGNEDDYVQAEAQDGLGSCNANFGTPSDGSRPRMQMYNCGSRDGDLDNGVIVHEYGHGISNRLTGGPSRSSCLYNSEQMGEGWSDWFGMVMTIEPGDMATDARPMGTWLFGQGPTGAGIRPYPYSTARSVNPMTYATIGSGVSVPHGVGSVWATMLWDLTWAMIDEYGFDPDLYNGTGGNNKAMELVIEGLKIQPCSPGFVDGRDAIIAADRISNGGAHECLIWQVFAARGLGYSASQGSTGSVTDGVEAFDMPPTCTVTLLKVADKTDAAIGENITYTITATNNRPITINNLVMKDILPGTVEFVSASNNGTTNNQVVTWPAISLLPNENYHVTVVAKIKGDLVQVAPLFTDDFENGTSDWEVTTDLGTSTWQLQNTISNSASNAFFAAGHNTWSTTNLVTDTELDLTNESELIFNHQYDIEYEWDAGLVEISIDQGSTWKSLGDYMTGHAYPTQITKHGFYGFHGNSGGFQETKIDLSAFRGNKALIRFRMFHDQSINKVGWYVDDISITNLGLAVVNQAEISNNDDISTSAFVQEPTQIDFTPTQDCTEGTAAQFDQSNILTSDYRAVNTISSKGIVLNGSVVGFYAGQSITLQPGFSVALGSDFTAKIESCNTGGGTSSFNDESSETQALNKTSSTTTLTNSTELIGKNNLAVRPNPFTYQATIDYELEKNGPVFIALHDLTGKTIQVLLNQLVQEKGNYQLTFNSNQLEGGVYWLTMRTSEEVLTKKLFLIKS